MNKKIRLVVIGPRGFPNVQGGIESFSEKLYPHLIEKGYCIQVFSIKRYASHKEWNGIKFIHIPTPSSKIFERPLYNFLSTIYCIFKRPDLIHIHSIASGTFIFFLKLFGLKIIARYNSQDYLHEKWNVFGKIILKNSEHQFLLTDYIITNNKTYLKHLQAKGRKNNITLIPNGVEKNSREKYNGLLQEYFPNIKEKFILFAGRITPEKNIETLINSFFLLNPKETSLIIAGGAAHNDNYFVELKNKYSDKRILFTGKLYREKLNCLFANCSLFVIPSFSEGTPNVLLEALSFNCKILASKIPAHLDFSFQEETYFNPNDVSELSQRINNKLLNDNLENYEGLLQKHHWLNIVEQIHHINQKVLNIES
ncbi:MAG: glycosyltransferase family 4 protein [Bacteroidetes bacterium]|nr:glycosyltransferase family 4 protein [Bacteroidota bacterium]